MNEHHIHLMNHPSNNNLPTAAASSAGVSLSGESVRHLTEAEKQKNLELDTKYSKAIREAHDLASSVTCTSCNRPLKEQGDTKFNLIRQISVCLARASSKCPFHVYQSIKRWLELPDGLFLTDRHLLRIVFFPVCSRGNNVTFTKTEPAKSTNDDVQENFLSFVTDKDKAHHSVRQTYQLVKECSLPLGPLLEPSVVRAAVATSHSPSSSASSSSPTKKKKDEGIAVYLKALADGSCPSTMLAANTRCLYLSEQYPISSMKAVYDAIPLHEFPETAKLDFGKPDNIYLTKLVRSLRACPAVISKWYTKRDQLVPLLNIAFQSSGVLLPDPLEDASFDVYILCIYREGQRRDLQPPRSDSTSTGSGSRSDLAATDEPALRADPPSTGNEDSDSSVADHDSPNSQTETLITSASSQPGEIASTAPSSPMLMNSNQSPISVPSTPTENDEDDDIEIQHHQQQSYQEECHSPVQANTTHSVSPPLHQCLVAQFSMGEASNISGNDAPHALASHKRARSASSLSMGSEDELHQDKKFKSHDNAQCFSPTDMQTAPSCNGIAPVGLASLMKDLYPELDPPHSPRFPSAVSNYSRQ